MIIYFLYLLAVCGTHMITVWSVPQQTVKQLCALLFSFLLGQILVIALKYFHSSLNDGFYGHFDLNSR